MSRRIVPITDQEMLAFYRTHVSAWESDPAAVGLSDEALTAVETAVEAVTAAWHARERLRAQAMAATQTYRDAVAQLAASGSAAVAMIRAHADVTGDEDVYQRALLPPPRRPTPAPPPETPTNLAATMASDGTIRLRWKGSTAYHQSFEILRSIDGATPVFIAAMRSKTWVDVNVPPGVRTLAYHVYGVRRDTRSNRAAFTTVQFGTRSGATAAETARAAA